MSQDQKTFTATLLDDEGTVDLPHELAEHMGLKPGDTLSFRIEEKDGAPVVILDKLD